MHPQTRLPLLALLVIAAFLPALTSASVYGGVLDPRFDPGGGPNAPVSALAYQPDGRVIIAGSFTSVGGLARGRLARLDASGALDPDYAAGAGADGPIYAVAALADGALLVAGNFRNYDGVPRARVARLDANGALDLGFDPGLGPNAAVLALTPLADGGLLIVGNFTNVSGVARGRLARLDASGALDLNYAVGTGANGEVRSLTPLPNGGLLIAGNFSSYDAVSRARVARLDANGALDPGFDPGLGPNATVYAIAAGPAGSAVIAGSFTTIGGVSRRAVARLDASGALDPGFAAPASISGWGYALSVASDGSVLVGGSLLAGTAGMANGLIRLGPDGSLASGQAGAGGPNDSILALAPQPDGQIIVGGMFTLYDGVPRAYVARLYGGASPSELRFGTGTLTVDEGVGSVVIALQRTGGAERRVAAQVFVGGGSAGPDDYKGFVAPLGLVERPDFRLTQVVPQPDGKILIAGEFALVDGVPRGRVARLNANGSLDPSFDPGAGADRVIEAVAILPDGKILIGGEFTSYDGVPRGRVARLNADGSLDSSFGLGAGANRSVWELIVQPDGKVLIGGEFTSYDGIPRGQVARLNAGGALDTGFAPVLGMSNPFVAGMALQPDGKLIIGGQFNRVNNINRQNLARLNADGSLDPGFLPPSINERVREVIVQADGNVLIVGLFTMVGGQERGRVARLNADGTLDSGFDPGVGADDFIVDVVSLPDNGVLIGGGFRNVSGVANGRIARLGPGGALVGAFDPGADNTVWDLALLADGTALVAGAFTNLGGVDRVGLVRIDGDGALDPSFRPYLGGARIFSWEDGAQGEQFLVLEVIDDTLVEGDETLELELGPLPGVSLGIPARLTLTIIDNDGPPATATATATTTPTATATDEPAATATTTPTATATDEPAATATTTPTATATDEPAATATTTPTATATATATVTSEPTPQPQPAPTSDRRVFLPLVRR